MRVLVATDAWHPQVNGVVRTLTSLSHSSRRLGVNIEFLTPAGFPCIPIPTYPGLRLALPRPREIARRIEAAKPDAIHIATEGPIGHVVSSYCRRHGRPFTTSYTTRFPEYISARLAIPEAWSYAVLRRFHAAATVTMVSTPSLMAEFKERTDNGEVAHWSDDWNGYPAARQRLLQQMHDTSLANPVVIGGDIHSFWNNDLKLDFDDPASPTVATELVGTSITSPGVPYELFASFLPENPHVRFFESRKRGYVMVELARDRMTARFQTISDVADPQATLSTLRSFTIEDGRAGAFV